MPLVLPTCELSHSEHVQSLQHQHIVIERNGDSECKSLCQRKRREQNQVPGVAVTFPVEKEEVDNGEDKRDVERPDTVKSEEKM